jgi:hypothetical protein
VLFFGTRTTTSSYPNSGMPGNEIQPVAIYQILENVQLSPSELFNVLQSLGNRALIEKQEQDNQALFNLSPVVRQYVKTEYSREGR